ncbi:MAG: phage BR0599 family protein [Bacillota bacterium]
MRPITRSLFRILNNEKLLPVQFLDLQLVGATTTSTIRLTDYGTPIHWAGADYVSVSLSRGGIEEILSSETGESPQSTLNVSNIDAGMANILSGVDLNGAAATLYLADRRLLTRGRDALILAQGEVRDPQLTGQTLLFQIVNAIGLMERLTVPRRLWQSECNYTFGSVACGVNLAEAPYTIETAAQDGTAGNCIVVPDSTLATAGNPIDLDDYWSRGYVLMGNGRCATQARPISHVEPGNGTVLFYVRYPFYLAPATGDSVILRRGCPKTTVACKARNNLLNFGGYPDVPSKEIEPTEVKDPR